MAPQPKKVALGSHRGSLCKPGTLLLRAKQGALVRKVNGLTHVSLKFAKYSLPFIIFLLGQLRNPHTHRKTIGMILPGMSAIEPKTLGPPALTT